MTVVTRGAIKLYYEEEGAGTPLVFLHEFAGDHRSWADQVRHFSRGYRCLTLAARGYPPSSVPEADDDYSQDIAVGDVIAVLDAAAIDRAHIVGLSMGAYTALRLVMQFPDRVRSIVAAGGGSGAERATRERFVAEALAYTRGYRDVTDPVGHAPLLLAGHQPELFHPGVWAKNIAIAQLARKFNGSSLNLNVDSDVAKATTLQIPRT